MRRPRLAPLALAPLALAALLASALLAPASVAAPTGGATPLRGPALAAAMKTRRLTQVAFDGATVDEVAKWLQIATGWNFVVKRHVIEKAGIDLGTVRAKLTLGQVTVAGFLALWLEPHGLVAKVEDSIVYVTTRADALGAPVLVLHGISHLTWTKTNFRGSDLDLHPSDWTPPDDRAEEELVEDDPFTDPQHVVDLVKQMVDAPWDSEGWAISATKQFLAVKAPRSVQAQVARALVQMEALK